MSKPEFLGEHTCVPTLLKSNIGKLILNNNKLPPYVICTGHESRVRESIKYFDKGTGILLTTLMKAVQLDYGRIEIAFGKYKGTPIIIFEHQIGCGAAEIYFKEILSNLCMSKKYKLNNGWIFNSDAKYIIRLGTSLGINNIYNKNDVNVKIGDIIINNKQIGISNTDFQAITSNLNIFDYDKSISKAKNYLKKIGYECDNNNIVLNSFDNKLRDILLKKTELNMKKYSDIIFKYNNKVLSLNNVSKDSLYAEESEKQFYKLRSEYNVGTSDMEASTLMKISKELSYNGNIIKCGCMLMCVGVIPGQSFGDINSFDKDTSQHIQWLSALDALHEISQNHLVTDIKPKL